MSDEKTALSEINREHEPGMTTPEELSEERCLKTAVENIRQGRRAMLSTVLNNGLLIGALAAASYGMYGISVKEQEEMASRRPEIERLEEIIGSGQCEKDAGVYLAQQDAYKNFTVMLKNKYPDVWSDNRVCHKEGWTNCLTDNEFLRQSTLYCPYINNPLFEGQFINDKVFRDQVASYAKLRDGDIYIPAGVKQVFNGLWLFAVLGISIHTIKKLKKLWGKLKHSMKCRDQHWQSAELQQASRAEEYQIAGSSTEANENIDMADGSDFNKQSRELLDELLDAKRKETTILAAIKQLLVKGQPGAGVYREGPVAELPKERLERMRIALNNDDIDQATKQFEALLEEVQPVEEVQGEEERGVPKSEKINY
jgi:hypothetical protein